MVIEPEEHFGVAVWKVVGYESGKQAAVKDDESKIDTFCGNGFIRSCAGEHAILLETKENIQRQKIDMNMTIISQIKMN